ncbi:hypothetical protein C6P46_000601 [Rhodotorula mucilaginosa]|uniref:Uncharacterized protein n=1 Tax=Rhodotorula mucilaginosa TaxID=5537 RepID=A0A9P7B8Q2_RHOMI|nr:hypothetical protein C6P46_000601 [Rhodotorula mucilaginosa]
MQSPYLSKFGRKLKAIRDISVPNTVGPTVDTFCTAVKEAEASAKAQNFFHWNEQNPQHRAILAELDAVCDKLQAFTRSHSSDANDADMDCDKVNEFLVRLGVLTSSKRAPGIDTQVPGFEAAYGDDPDKACARFCTEVGLAWSTSGERWPHQGDGEIHTQIKGAFAQLCAKLQSKPCLDNLNDVVNWELEKEQLLANTESEILHLFKELKNSKQVEKVTQARKKRQNKKAAAATTAATAAPEAPATNSVGRAARLVMSPRQQEIYAGATSGARRGPTFREFRLL